jgi:hypothetical protein
MPGTPATSPRFGVPRCSDGDVASFSAQVNAITDGFDLEAAGYLSGVASARPAAATANAGFLYRATDTGAWTVSTGSAWLSLTTRFVQTLRVTSAGSITAGGRGTLAASSWPIAFPDTNYSIALTAGDPGLIVTASLITASGFVVTAFNATTATISSPVAIHATGVHD